VFVATLLGGWSRFEWELSFVRSRIIEGNSSRRPFLCVFSTFAALFTLTTFR
jgi:hypothetical protein